MSSKYSIILYIQVLMIVIDILFNACSVLLHYSPTILLMIYILQDTLLVMSSILLFISLSTTFIFRIGLIPLILSTFLPTIISTLMYIVISIGYHYTLLSTTWIDDDDYDRSNDEFVAYENNGITSFYILHKFAACLYYSLYKRAALHLTEPKYNQDSQSLRRKFQNYFDISNLGDDTDTTNKGEANVN